MCHIMLYAICGLYRKYNMTYIWHICKQYVTQMRLLSVSHIANAM
jgi:hypothetical protein